MDMGTVAVAAVMALGQLSCLVFLVKKYTNSIDEHSKTLPDLVATLREISKSAEKTGKHLDELFESRNDHEKRIERMETVHELRGCNEPIRPNWRDPNLKANG